MGVSLNTHRLLSYCVVLGFLLDLSISGSLWTVFYDTLEYRCSIKCDHVSQTALH